MKPIILLISITVLLSTSACGQNAKITIPDTSEMYAMSETVIKYENGAKYYLKGTDKPYTGFLYAKYDNGQPLSVQQFENGMGNGIWINYDPEGNKECQGTYVKNRVEGPVTFYYEDGSIKSTGQYRDWKRPIGLWAYYDRKGNVVSKIVFTP